MYMATRLRTQNYVTSLITTFALCQKTGPNISDDFHSQSFCHQFGERPWVEWGWGRHCGESRNGEF